MGMEARGGGGAVQDCVMPERWGCMGLGQEEDIHEKRSWESTESCVGSDVRSEPGTHTLHFKPIRFTG